MKYLDKHHHQRERGGFEDLEPYYIELPDTSNHNNMLVGNNASLYQEWRNIILDLSLRKIKNKEYIHIAALPLLASDYSDSLSVMIDYTDLCTFNTGNLVDTLGVPDDYIDILYPIELNIHDPTVVGYLFEAGAVPTDPFVEVALKYYHDSLVSMLKVRPETVGSITNLYRSKMVSHRKGRKIILAETNIDIALKC